MTQTISSPGVWINDLFVTAETLREGAFADQPGLLAVERFLADWFSDREEVEMRTSGSTGEPRVIKLSKETMRQSARATNRFFGLKPGDEILLALSADYIAGKMMLVRAIEGGLRVTAVEPGADPLAHVKKHFRFCAMVPLQVRQSLDAGRFEELDDIEYLIIGGSEVSSSLRDELQLLRTRCYSTYGMTETASHVALMRLNGFSVVDVYAALPGITFSQDERGCLVVNAPALLDHPLLTNDVVELPDETHFIWRGRYDYVVNSGGVKLFPETIERKIASLFERRFFLGKEADERLGERLVLWVEGEPFAAEEEETLLDAIRKRVDRYENPKRMGYMPKFLETPTGKIRRIL